MFILSVLYYIFHTAYTLLVLWVPAKMQFCVVPQHIVSDWLQFVWIKFFNALPELAEPGPWITFIMLRIHN